MGRDTFTRAAYTQSVGAKTRAGQSATSRGHERVRDTGKLDPLVDPAMHGVIRPSRPRFEEITDGPNKGMFELTTGCPMTIETRLDTTGSMGGNVGKGLKVLPDLHEMSSSMLPGFDIQMAIGIFADCRDRYVLCRPQFEALAERMVDQLTLMYPEGGGAANHGEDPQYGLFGGAYLVNAYINRIGLKGYDFTISDEPARDYLVIDELERVFGKEVLAKCKENGHKISKDDLPSTAQVVQDLQKRAHAFFLVVDPTYDDTVSFWQTMYGAERVILMPRVELLPQVQTILIGLTEGTMGLGDIAEFLKEHKVTKREAEAIEASVANVPLGAQVPLREAIRVPQAGDIYATKTDQWPTILVEDRTDGDVPVGAAASAAEAGPDWL